MPLAMMMICRTFISQTSNSSSSGSRQAREELKKKENHLHTISKMMGTLVHVQLYTFSYRKPVIRPQICQKQLKYQIPNTNNAKYAFDERIDGIFCVNLKPANFCRPVLLESHCTKCMKILFGLFLFQKCSL